MDRRSPATGPDRTSRSSPNPYSANADKLDCDPQIGLRLARALVMLVYHGHRL